MDWWIFQVFEVRRRYLEALLRQNVGWYDTVQDKNFVSRISEWVKACQVNLFENLFYNWWIFSCPIFRDLVKVQEATGKND